MVLLTVTVFLSGTVFAQDTHNAIDAHEHDELEVVDVQESPEAVEKFNNLIASLEPEKARLILEDNELVSMMKRDAYWAPQVKVNRNAFRLLFTSLPVSGYPVNSYYTYNGSACTCHSFCTPSIPSSSFSKYRCYNPSASASGNCIRYNGTGAIQCKGFADYVFNQYTGADISESTKVSDYPTGFTNDSNGEEVIAEFFGRMPVGSNIRVSVRNASYNHSFIISAKSPTGITMYDCNGSSSRCQIKNTTRSWTTLVSKYDGIIYAWAA